MTNTSGKFFAPAYNDARRWSRQPAWSGFTGGTSFGLGVGYQFNSWFRADITGEYRCKVHFSGTDFATFPGSAPISDVYSGGYTSWVGLVNAYVDLGTWWCMTPFVGAGVGGAHQSDQRAPGLRRDSEPRRRLGQRRLLFRQRRFQDQLRLGGPCRCRLQGQPELHGRTGLSLSRYGHRRHRPRRYLRRHAQPAAPSSSTT